MANHYVLVIDDDPDFREIVKIAVEDWGFECLEAADCAAALHAIEGAGVALEMVLLDYFMPGLEPGCCVERLVARLGPDVPIVLVSASVDIIERAHRIGLDRVLAKPFEMEELHAVLVGQH